MQNEFPHAKVETNRYAPGEWKTLTSDSTKQVLLIVTKLFNPSEEDLDYLTGFTQKGNYVFISALQMTSTASKFTQAVTNIETEAATKTTLQLQCFNARCSSCF